MCISLDAFSGLERGFPKRLVSSSLHIPQIKVYFAIPVGHPREGRLEVSCGEDGLPFFVFLHFYSASSEFFRHFFGFL